MPDSTRLGNRLDSGYRPTSISSRYWSPPLPRPTDIRLLEAHCRTTRIAYRTPIKFGGRVVTDALLLDVEVLVETADHRRATGHGSMPLGNVWAWPTGSVATDETLAVMLA